MPTRPSKSLKGKYIELRPELAEGMERLAEQNRRTFREEVEHAFERHLASPPVTVFSRETPPLPPAEVEVAPPPEPAPEPLKPKRTRKKKAE